MVSAPPALAEFLDGLRKVGATEAARDALPAAADPVVYAVTQLGDPWLLLVALALFYWYGPDRRRGALAVALALGALALIAGLKAYFGLARPDLAAYPADGYGFPSGHALGSTVVWGSVALLAERWDRDRRLAAAAVVVAAVALSRVLLGVHYLGDVVAGVAIGATFLWVTLAAVDGDPLRAFAVTAALGLGALAVGAGGDGAAALAGAVGGGAVWWVLDVEGPLHPAVAAGGLAVLGGLFVAVTVLEPPLAVGFLAYVVVVGGLVSMPAVQRVGGERLNER